MEIICTGVFGQMGRAYGYSRCSTSAGDWAIQLDALARVDDRDIHREKASGVKRDRTELRRVLDLLRPDDRLHVYALDRLARSQLHLLQIVEEIEQKGAKLVSLRESIDTSSAVGRFFVGVLGSLAAMERELILERTKAGVALARERNVRFGRPAKLSPSLIRQVLLAHDDPATTVPETCRVLGISRSSYYSALRAGRLQDKDLVVKVA
jgi:DNA invertase Pin-like site-specific DNA recombinase